MLPRHKMQATDCGSGVRQRKTVKRQLLLMSRAIRSPAGSNQNRLHSLNVAAFLGEARRETSPPEIPATGRAKPHPTPYLIARHKIAYGRQIGERLRTGRCGHRQRLPPETVATWLPQQSCKYRFSDISNIQRSRHHHFGEQSSFSCMMGPALNQSSSYFTARPSPAAPCRGSFRKWRR
jgi:hypothetical protein